jgi:hypothetical protein
MVPRGRRTRFRAKVRSLVLHGGLALGLLLPERALAQQTQALQFYPEVEVPVTIALGTYWLSTELLFKDALAPEPCRVCGTAAGIDGATRRALRWNNTSAAATASNVVA